MGRRKNQKGHKSPSNGQTGRIISANSGHYTVTCNADLIACSMAGKLLHNRKSADESPVVGDEVIFESAGGHRGRISDVLPRKNVFRRRASGAKSKPQAVAANVDQLVAVFAVTQPKPSWAMLDRYLVIAESMGVDALICITKVDLVDWEDFRNQMPPYEELGYEVLPVSTVSDTGLAQLRDRLAGKASVLAGKSGVGKTSLLNSILPGEAMSVGAVSSKTGKGRHTTTSAQAHSLGDGGVVIDTPGTRELGLWDVESDTLDSLFPEMRPYLGKCRFGGGCQHVQESDCAVKAAVRDGVIHPNRYSSYLKMLSRDDGDRGSDGDGQRGPSSAPQAFVCQRCGNTITSDASGVDHRNHCPRCLWSVHLDVRPGDRAAACGGLMEPIAVWVRSQKEWAIIHRCQECGAIRSNLVAGDDNEVMLVSLAVRALAQPAFPLDRLAQ